MHPPDDAAPTEDDLVDTPRDSTPLTREGYCGPESPPSGAPSSVNHLPPDPAAAIRLEAARWAERVCRDDNLDAAPPDATGEGSGEPGSAVAPFSPPAPSDGTPGEETAVREYRPVWERAYLAALAVGGEVTGAADAVGVDRTTPYKYAGRSPRFARLWDEAIERAKDLARRECFTRGVIGWQEPVFFGGECIGHVPRKSDRCLELYLKAHDPAYRDKQSVELSGPAGGPVRTRAEIAAQMEPYESAVGLLVDSLVALRQLEATTTPALPAPAGPVVIDAEAVPAPPSPPTGKPCPRGDKPGENPYCPLCHGAGVVAPRLT